MRTIYATAFSQNTMTTGLIAYKIWQQDRLSQGLVTHTMSLAPLIRITVESASIYVLNVLILIILYAVESNGQYVAQEALVPVCGESQLNLFGRRSNSANDYRHRVYIDDRSVSYADITCIDDHTT